MATPVRRAPLGWVAVFWLVASACNCGPVPQTANQPEALSAPDAGGLPLCPSDTRLCNATCATIASDPQNCGQCNRACGEKEVCSDGQCALGCAAGKTDCSRSCVDLKTDKKHCGACGNACGANYACVGGACECNAAGFEVCGGACVDTKKSAEHCGACGNACPAGQACFGGVCDTVCNAGLSRCGPLPSTCVDLQNDRQNCGACGVPCGGQQVCAAGVCTCAPHLMQCGTACIDVQGDASNCGTCGNVCNGQPCFAGQCLEPCAQGLTRCGTACLDLSKDISHCGMCQRACLGSTTCSGGQCVACDSATTDCDGDGWKVSEGDCCDTQGACGVPPETVNPGAFEVPNNTVDDNCNGLVDLQDPETQSCDSLLQSNATDPVAYAKALGLCKTAVETPATLGQRTWGVISAQLLRADGSPLKYQAGKSIRQNFGTGLLPKEGERLVVLSSGVAADATQTQPGPNGGPMNNLETEHGGTDEEVDISACTLPYCIKDWFGVATPPLKSANALPNAPGCGSSDPETEKYAMDSVMLVLRMRAPTNARAFEFSSFFLSAEYPEYVCSDFNDQLVALVTTPNGTPAVPNPVDRNLMTYTQGGRRWPIGINVAHGTDLFAVCRPKASDSCWEPTVDARSCSLGPSLLAGTGLEAPPNECTVGGGTRWLTTSGNVAPGQLVELRIAIWDVGDHIFDSIALLDGFKWLTTSQLPGTD